MEADPRSWDTAPEGVATLWLGIDVGGTKTALGLGDEAGNLRARRRRATEPSGDPERDLARIVEDARSLLSEAGASLDDVAAVGVSLPGPLDLEAGCVVNPPNLEGWASVPVREPLERAFGRPVHLENDANAAALAEYHFGAGQGSRHMVYLTMSTGVGGGVIADGRLYRGSHTSAGEFGHMPIVWQGERCGCGLRGCLEAYTGGASWTRRLRRETPAEGLLAELAGGTDRVTPVHLVEAARRGDDFALAEMRRWTEHLAIGIVHVLFALAPEVIVLGTIAAAAGEALCFEPLRRIVNENCWPLVAGDVRIIPTALGEDLPYLAGLAAAVEGQLEARSSSD